MTVFLGIVALVAMLPPDQEDLHNRCSWYQMDLRRALLAYAKAHGNSYPEALKDLVPDYLDKLPICDMGNYWNTYDYESGGQTYSLRCSLHGEEPDSERVQ